MSSHAPRGGVELNDSVRLGLPLGRTKEKPTTVCNSFLIICFKESLKRFRSFMNVTSLIDSTREQSGIEGIKRTFRVHVASELVLIAQIAH